MSLLKGYHVLRPSDVKAIFWKTDSMVQVDHFFNMQFVHMWLNEVMFLLQWPVYIM